MLVNWNFQRPNPNIPIAVARIQEQRNQNRLANMLAQQRMGLAERGMDLREQELNRRIAQADRAELAGAMQGLGIVFSRASQLDDPNAQNAMVNEYVTTARRLYPSLAASGAFDDVTGYSPELAQRFAAFGPAPERGPLQEWARDFEASMGRPPTQREMEIQAGIRARPTARAPARPQVVNRPDGSVWMFDPNTRSFSQLEGGLPPDAPDPPSLGDINALRDDLTAQTRDAAAARTAYGSINAIVSQDDISGTDDLALIYALQNIIDPGVSVRGEDVNTIVGMGSVAPMVRQYANILSGSGTFSAEQRAELERTARTLAQGRVQNALQAQERFSAIAQRHNINPADIMSRDFSGELPPLAAGANDDLPVIDLRRRSPPGPGGMAR